MNKVVRLIFGLVFTVGAYVSVNAQTSADSLAKDDAIVCRQISDNVFDCYVKEGKTDQGKMNENGKKPEGKKNNNNEYKVPSQKEEAPIDWNRSDVIEHDNGNRGMDL